jgi:membrane associated rhomboid family serine protease
MWLDDFIYIERNKGEKTPHRSLDDGFIQLALIIFIFSVLCFIFPVFKYLLAVHSSDILKWNSISLITSSLIHKDWSHLTNNMIFFLLYAPPVEERVGKKNFILLFFVCSVIGGIINYKFTKHLAPHITLGTSGVIFGIMTYASLIFYSRKIVILKTFKVPFWTLAAYFILQEFIAARIMYRNEFSDQGIHTAHIGHISGAAVGFLYYLVFGDKQYKINLPHLGWNGSDYLDIFMAATCPIVLIIYKDIPYFAKFSIAAASIWNPKFAILIALYFTFEIIHSNKSGRNKKKEQIQV